MKKVIGIVIFCLCFATLNAQWTTSGTNIYNSNTGSVGIGVTSFLGSEKFRVVGDINLGGSQYITKSINSNLLPTYPAASATLENYYTINGAATYNMNDNYAVDNLLFIQGFAQAIGGYQSGGSRSQLYINNANYTSTFGHIWSAACNQIVTSGTTTADKLVNTYIKSQFGSSAVTNYYDLYLETPATSEPTNHWAIWQEDPIARSYVAGKVGFGTTTPTASLHIKAGTATANTAPLKFTSGVLLTTTEAGAIEYDGTHLYFTAANAGTRYQLDQQAGGGTNFWTLSGTNIYTNTAGSVGIGTNAPGPYKLAVEGTIGARKIKVTQANPWADYVFEKDYQLPSLKEIETYIQQYKHLPEVPSAQEVNRDGLDLGDNQAMLLKKIEELTLYVIDINKKLEKLSIENSELKKKLKK